MVPILKGNTPYLEQLLAVKFSNDGVFAAIAFQVKEVNEIMIYKMMEVDKQNKELKVLHEKKALKPLKHFKGPELKIMGPAVDLFIFPQKNNQGGYSYCLYLIF